MDLNESSSLLNAVSQTFGQNNRNTKGLTIFFAVICVVDVFGVFPIVALPKAVIQCDWYGIPLVIFVFLLQIYTALILGKCWLIAEDINKSIIVKNRYPYVAIAEMTYGKNMSRFVTVLLDVTVFGAGIPNLLVAAQNVQIIGTKMSEESIQLSYCYWMLIIATALCPFLWLGSPKDMKVLCSVSVVIVLSVCIMTWICIIQDDTQIIPPTEFETGNSVWKNIISAYGIIAFQFDIHPMLLTIHVDMKDKRKIPWVIIGGFSCTALLFIITTIIAYLKYGINTYSNILQGLPPSVLLYINVLLVTLQLCLTSAVGNSTLYQHVEDFLSIPRDFNHKRCLIRTTLTVLAVFIAETVPRFDIVMSFIGGTLTAPLVFILPPLFYLKLLYLKSQHVRSLTLQQANHYMYHTDTDIILVEACKYNCSRIRHTSQVSLTRNHHFLTRDKNFWNLVKYEFFLIVIVILFGIVSTIITTYINIVDTIKYAAFSPPCIYNITAATSSV